MQAARTGLDEGSEGTRGSQEATSFDGAQEALFCNCLLQQKQTPCSARLAESLVVLVGKDRVHDRLLRDFMCNWS